MAFEIMEFGVTGGALIVAMLLYSFYFYRNRTAVSSRMPPGPAPWPVIGSLNKVGTLPHRDLQKLSQIYGSIMTVNFGSRPVVIVSSPEVAKECLKLNDMAFASRPRTAAGDILGYGSTDIVFTEYGPKWRSMRKALNEEMLHSTRFGQFHGVRKDELMIVFRSVLDASKTGESVQTLRMMENLTSNNVTRMLMSECYQGPNSTCTEEEGKEIADMVHEISFLSGVFNLGDWIPSIKRLDLQGFEKRMKDIHSRLDGKLQSLIDNRRARLEASSGNTRNSSQVQGSSGPEDFVDSMLKKPPSYRLTDTQIKAILTDILVAAAETTAGTFEWTLTDLIMNPDIMNKVRAELDSAVGPHRLVEEADLPKFVYLRSVIKESLRLRTTVPLMVPHETTKKCTISGYDIPAHTRVFFNIFAIQHDPAIWDRPNEFLPERFDKLEVDIQGHHHQLFPFGSGRRMCPGWGMALVMLQYTLGMLLHAFHFSLPAGQKPEDLDTAEKWGLTVFKAVPLELVATPRLAPEVYDNALQA